MTNHQLARLFDEFSKKTNICEMIGEIERLLNLINK